MEVSWSSRSLRPGEGAGIRLSEALRIRGGIGVVAMADDYVEEEGIGLTHWSRACGTGVGLSAHKNQYRHG